MTDETPTPEAPLPDTTQPTPEGETSVEASFDSALQALQAERDQILETLLRTQAEFENIRKRQQRTARKFRPWMRTVPRRTKEQRFLDKRFRGQ